MSRENLAHWHLFAMSRAVALKSRERVWKRIGRDEQDNSNLRFNARDGTRGINSNLRFNVRDRTRLDWCPYLLFRQISIQNVSMYAGLCKMGVYVGCFIRIRVNFLGSPP